MERKRKVNRKRSVSKRLFVQWILCWLCLSLLLIFIANIFMHLFSCPRETGEKNTLTLREYRNCEIGEDGQFIRIEDRVPIKLFYSVARPSEKLSKIVLDFGKPTDAYLWLELYYPDEEGNYPLEYARKERLVSGLTEHVIDVEPGKYQEIRIDFVQMESNREVCIKNIYAGEPGKMMLYADKALRHRIWGICFFCSFCLSVLLFTCEKSRTVWEKLCGLARSFLISLYNAIDISKSLKVVEGGILIGGCLEGIAMLLHSRGFNGKEAFIYSVIGMLLLSFFMFREAYTKKLECVSFFVFFLLAFTFICVIPISLGTCWDDDTHYYRIISMARTNTGTITEADDLFCADVASVINDSKRFQKDHSKQKEYNYNEEYRNGVVLENHYVFNYKDIAYLPFVLGIWFAYGFGLSFCMTAFVAKLFQLFFIGALVYASVKKLRSGRILLIVFVLVPTVLFLAVSYSYDSWLTFLLLYAFSRYFGELQRKDVKLTFAGFCKIFVPAFLALLPKLVYAPMLFLMAYMPKSKWKEKKWRIAYHACFVCAALFMVCVVLYAASGQMPIGSGDSRGAMGVNGDRQLRYMIHHFDAYCHTLCVFLRSYFSYDATEEYLTSLFNLGSLDLQYIAIPLLFAAVVWDRSSLDDKTIPMFSKIAALIMPVMIVVICATVMYLVFTPVASNEICGCQGRYLLPAVFPSLFMLSRCKPFTGIRGKTLPIEHRQKVLVELSAEEIGNMALIFLSACFLLYNLWLHCASKY